MYYSYYGLRELPFRITPDPRLFYVGGERGLILNALLYAINNGEGIIKVVGEVGSGKTMLCRMLPEKLPPKIEILYLANPHLTPDNILQAVALEMQLNLPQTANRLEILHALQTTLLEKHAQNKQVILLIEEAQSMPLETLEEIRLLSNLETTKHKLLQIVLFGQPELDQNLSQTHIRQIKERITHSFYLKPLSKKDVATYIDFRLRSVGYKGAPLFNQRAIKHLTKYSKGLLRRVNILADKAMLAAFAENTYFIKAKHVHQAAQDSGFTINSQQAILLYFIMFLIIIGILWWFGIERLYL
jgi:MSHA biogenesis protein MshM